MPDDESAARIMMIPMHPGIQYHFARVGLPTYFLGHWDQFKYWRPQPDNVINLLPAYHEDHLSYGPDDYRKLLEAMLAPSPERFDAIWSHFPWQAKLLAEFEHPKKIYFVAKYDELSEALWAQLLNRKDFMLASYYPRTTSWVKARFGVLLPEIQLGVDPEEYCGWTGQESVILTVIHSWAQRGWHHETYLEATAGLRTLHVDHLDPAQPTRLYADILALFRSSRVYLHDGEREYTIVLIEAMMTGMPIVSFALPGIERYVEHGVNGFIGYTAAEIRDYCQMLLADEQLARKFGEESRRKALASHDEARWRADWCQLIGSAL